MVLSELAPTAVTPLLSDLSTPTEVKKSPAQNNDLIYFCELDSSNKLNHWTARSLYNSRRTNLS